MLCTPLAISVRIAPGKPPSQAQAQHFFTESIPLESQPAYHSRTRYSPDINHCNSQPASHELSGHLNVVIIISILENKPLDVLIVVKIITILSSRGMDRLLVGPGGKDNISLYTSQY